MKRLMISEVLDRASRAQTTEEKITILKENNTLGLRDVLRGAFDDSIVFTLPKGLPPYKSMLSQEGTPPTDLTRSTRQFTYFVKGGKGDSIPAARREKIFLAILEGVHPKDAQVVAAMKEKTLGELFPGIDKALVKTVWPKLLEK